jgi:small subunit ribosomal protein S21
MAMSFFPRMQPVPRPARPSQDVTGVLEGLPSVRNVDDRALFIKKEFPETVQVVVRDNNVDQALKVLKKKMQREGIFREMKLRRSYEKPSERRAREKAEAVRRARKLERKRIEREGF